MPVNKIGRIEGRADGFFDGFLEGAVDIMIEDSVGDSVIAAEGSDVGELVDWKTGLLVGATVESFLAGVTAYRALV